MDGEQNSEHRGNALPSPEPDINREDVPEERTNPKSQFKVDELRSGRIIIPDEIRKLNCK